MCLDTELSIQNWVEAFSQLLFYIAKEEMCQLKLIGAVHWTVHLKKIQSDGKLFGLLKLVTCG